ncbi:MAG: ATP-binding protein [Puniceicoccales bacterium]|jgi:predicted AAA+ superfamily ATPase|nr:ATP-binding protein [Puniceicoccales bacterium]
MIPRIYDTVLPSLVQPGRVLALYGPRRSGKTTLLKNYAATFAGTLGKVLSVTGEDISIQETLGSRSVETIRRFFAGFDCVIIDEAQAAPGIGAGLKLLVDHLPETRVIISGSSSFKLAGEVGEPLVGRKTTLNLFPISAAEIVRQGGVPALAAALEGFLIYGMYPEILTQDVNDARRARLLELRDDFLFRDIIAFEGIKNSAKIRRLLQLLSFQVGKEVSLTELATGVGISRQVVERYLDLLEKTFVIFRIGGFSRNLRSEITKSVRYYFADNGILNALQNNFVPVGARADTGALWENWLVAERVKRNAYFNHPANSYFWRTYAQQEIDWVEEIDGTLSGFEFKWGGKTPKTPTAWRGAYPDASFSVINRETYLSFVLPDEATRGGAQE